MSNTIDWGKIHYSSYSPETNLTGTASAPSFSNTYSLEYDGVDQYIDLDSRTQNFTDFSLSFWIKPSTLVGASFDGIIGQDSTTAQGGILRYIAIDGTVIKSFLGSWTNLSSTLTLGTWHNIILTYDSGLNVLKAYTDGTLSTTINSPNFSGQSTNAHSFKRIAIRSNSLTTCFAGNLDEIAVWNSVINIANVWDGSGIPTNLTSTNPIHWWRFETGSGTTATDSGSGGINGSLVNSPTYDTDVPT